MICRAIDGVLDVLVATLVDEGMLIRDPKRGYRLGATLGVLEQALARRDLLSELERLVVFAHGREPGPEPRI